MFNDSTNDINRLSQSIKNDMTALKSDIEALSTKLGLSGAKGSQARQHSVHLVNNLKTQLGKQSKVFQDVLQDRAKALKDQQARRFRMGVANTPGTALGRPMVFGQQNEGGHAGETVSNCAIGGEHHRARLYSVRTWIRMIRAGDSLMPLCDFRNSR